MKNNLTLFVILIIALIILGAFFFIPISRPSMDNNGSLTSISTSTPALEINNDFMANISDSFLNYKVFQQSQHAIGLATDKFDLVDTNTNSIIYTAETGDSFSISSVSHLPYLVLVYSCANCDAPPQGSYIFNVTNGKSLKMPFEDVVAINFDNQIFQAQTYEYKNQECSPEEPFCPQAKSFISARSYSFDSLK